MGQKDVRDDAYVGMLIAKTPFEAVEAADDLLAGAEHGDRKAIAGLSKALAFHERNGSELGRDALAEVAELRAVIDDAT